MQNRRNKPQKSPPIKIFNNSGSVEVTIYRELKNIKQMDEEERKEREQRQTIAKEAWDTCCVTNFVIAHLTCT